MLDCPPRDIQLIDGTDRQPHLLHTQPHSRVSIHVAYAGVWIIIGISVAELGIGAVVPVAGRIIVADSPLGQETIRTTVLPKNLFPGAHAEPQQQARHASLLGLAITGSLDPGPVIAIRYGAATIVNTATDQRCHILDLPMPGKIAAAVALAQLVTRVDAFGWIKNEKLRPH